MKCIFWRRVWGLSSEKQEQKLYSVGLIFSAPSVLFPPVLISSAQLLLKPLGQRWCWIPDEEQQSLRERHRKLRLKDAWLDCKMLELDCRLSHHGATTTRSPAPFVGDYVGPWKVAIFHVALFLDFFFIL